ncbi:hypothetical protein K435DRAFT_772091 [Dendrothele bispora CBS 962.96]|uniref:Uncharacterized protein n=1 Tax=Dendrothele bispora (strain CBS 962.96) TaxID=1314807 RepID=A0A4S8MYW2_DENBC|nr:hypothetical protein K435DRAFT_772091 [Dendrothele bispora CBS 962.96]
MPDHHTLLGSCPCTIPLLIHTILPPLTRHTRIQADRQMECIVRKAILLIPCIPIRTPFQATSYRIHPGRTTTYNQATFEEYLQHQAIPPGINNIIASKVVQWIPHYRAHGRDQYSSNRNEATDIICKVQRPIFPTLAKCTIMVRATA